MPGRLRLIFHDRVDSTMRIARQLAEEGAAEGATVVAREQTEGRGRHGNRWYAPPDTALLMTMILRPRLVESTPPLPTLSLAAGVALLEVVHQLDVTAARLKWPNDILVDERKLAGILAESISVADGEAVVLVGIGLNLRPSPPELLPPELPSLMTDLESEGGPALEIDDAALWVGRHLLQRVAAWSDAGLDDVLAQWRKWDGLYGRPVRAQGAVGPVRGIARGVTETGALRVQQEDGELLTVNAGQVELLRLDSLAGAR